MPRDPFYNTARWKWLRRWKLRENPMCEHCGKKESTDVDHKTAINQGGDPLDRDNLQALCHECHSRKTIYVERFGKDKVPVKGVDPATGLPIDPEHWWNKSRWV